MTITWGVQGRYGHFAVDEYWDTDSGQHGTVDMFKTRKQATAVAEALNDAYKRGYEQGKADQ